MTKTLQQARKTVDIAIAEAIARKDAPLTIRGWLARFEEIENRAETAQNG